ncbi:MAG: MaoC family dehydratase, partial [Rhodospirillaceae bacterium]
GTIAHGMLCSSFISTVVGTRLPGPGCVYISQNLKFKAPVRPGDTVTARATVIELKPEKSRVTLETVCTVGDTVVISGQAEVLVPRRNTHDA